MPQKKKTSDVKQVRETMIRVYKAFEALDAEKLDANFSHSSELVAFGTDWDEKFVGWSAYRNVHKTQFGALKSFKFTSRELEIHTNGSAAWASDRPHWEIETKEGEVLSEDVRITAVLKRSTAKEPWLVVHWHVSVGLKKRLHEY